MAGHDYLTLQLVRLTVPEERIVGGNGLSLVFPKEGAGNYISGAAVYRLRPGDVLVVNGASQGKLCVVKGTELVFWQFLSSIESLLPLFDCDEICRLQGITDRFKSARFYPAPSAVAKECHRLLAEAPPRFGLDQRGQLLRVVAAILTSEFNNLPLAREGYVSLKDHMRQVLEKLSLTEILSLSTDELASRFGCTRRHLTRLFNQHFGFSASALRMELRLLKAMTLLRDPGAKVIDVAEQSGFNHLGLFNSCFKRRFNATPGQWRRKMLESSDRSAAGLWGNPACRIRALRLCPWSGSDEESNNPEPQALQGRQKTGSGPGVVGACPAAETVLCDSDSSSAREANSGMLEVEIPCARVRGRQTRICFDPEGVRK